MSPAKSVGDFLREWRRRRRLSQLDFAIQAGISARHLSFLETGRSLPSREMVLRLAEQLQLPLRERNVLLNAAGFAAVFPERHLGDPGLEVVHKAIEVILKGHEPYPAIAIDRHWTLIASNGAFRPFLGGVEPDLLQPPVNVLRLTLHPCGLGPRLANYHEWRSHVLDKLHHQIELSGDAVLAELAGELRAYPAANEPQISSPPRDREWQRFAIPFQIVTETGVLSFFSTTTIFGTPLDITLSELSLECFYPADAATAEALRRMQNTPVTASR